MTYRRLNAIFQAVYGVTIKQMQGILRVEQAKRMLSSGYTILETSAACGFEDYFYFLKVFKSKTAMTALPVSGDLFRYPLTSRKHIHEMAELLPVR